MGVGITRRKYLKGNLLIPILFYYLSTNTCNGSFLIFSWDDGINDQEQAIEEAFNTCLEANITALDNKVSLAL
jgi:hypothetical protein